MSISQLLSNDTNQAVYSPTFQPFEPTRQHGIQNLLNSDNEEKYQMADSDTDTEDIPLIRSPKVLHQYHQNQHHHHPQEEVIIDNRDPIIVTSKVTNIYLYHLHVFVYSLYIYMYIFFLCI